MTNYVSWKKTTVHLYEFVTQLNYQTDEPFQTFNPEISFRRLTVTHGTTAHYRALKTVTTEAYSITIIQINSDKKIYFLFS